MSLKVEKNKFVSVEYTGTLENGDVFDTSTGGRPLEVKMGAGQLIAGFEKELAKDEKQVRKLLSAVSLKKLEKEIENKWNEVQKDIKQDVKEVKEVVEAVKEKSKEAVTSVQQTLSELKPNEDKINQLFEDAKKIKDESKRINEVVYDLGKADMSFIAEKLGMGVKRVEHLAKELAEQGKIEIYNIPGNGYELRRKK